MQIIPFLAEHLLLVDLQPEQTHEQAMLCDPNYGNTLYLAGPGYTAVHEGVVLGCGGAIEYHPGRGEVWAVLSRHIGPHMRAVTRAVNGWMSQAKYKRLEANVATDFDAGLRWIRLLKFEQEGPARQAFFPDGRPALPFVRIKGETWL